MKGAEGGIEVATVADAAEIADVEALVVEEVVVGVVSPAPRLAAQE